MFKILLVAVVAIGFVQAGDKSMKAFNTANIPADLGINAPPKEMKVSLVLINKRCPDFEAREFIAGLMLIRLMPD